MISFFIEYVRLICCKFYAIYHIRRNFKAILYSFSKFFGNFSNFYQKNTAEKKLCGISYKIAYFFKRPLMILANASAI